jgi:hypothetical protein
MKELFLVGLVAQQLEQRTHNGNLRELNKRLAFEINNLAAHQPITARHCLQLPNLQRKNNAKKLCRSTFSNSAGHFGAAGCERGVVGLC